MFRRVTFDDLKMERSQTIESKKTINNIISKSRENARHEVCLLCGKKTDGFCNSHCIPQMVLRNVAYSGKVQSFSSLIENEYLPSEKGIKNAGTFHNICRNCDSNRFQVYENEDVYSDDIVSNNELINQIALKNILRDIYKHEVEIEMYKLLPKESKRINGIALPKIFCKVLEAQIIAKKADVKECYIALEKCKKSISSKEPWLKLIMCEQLDYVVPIAYQGRIPLTTGFDHEIINEKFSYKKGYFLEYIHIVVFPLKNKSVIMIFMDKENERYEKFISRINSLSKTKRIQCVNYILFLCCEDYYFSKKLSERKIDSIKEIASLFEDIVSLDPETTTREEVIDYDLNKAWKAKNVLGMHV